MPVLVVYPVPVSPPPVLARELSNGTVAWYLSDHLGTVRDIVNNSGGIIDHVDYSAFGSVLNELSPSNGDRMTGFAGRKFRGHHT